MKLLIPCGLAVLMWTSAAATSSAQLPRFPACYDLEVGEWSPPFQGGDSLYGLPPRMLLDTTELSARLNPFRDEGASVLARAPGAMPSSFEMSSWKLLNDSLRLIWGNGFSGVVVLLPARSGRLVGHLQTYSDNVVGPPKTARITATPVSCSAPLSKEAAFSYPFVRGIAFARADSLLVGEPLPASLTVQPGSARSYRIMTRPADLYAPATLVSATLSEDLRVREIHVWFPPAANYDQIIEQLVALNDAPTSQQNRKNANGRLIRGASWSSRTISITVNGSNEQVTISFRGPAAGM